MKVALVLSGQLRSWKAGSEYIKKNLLDHYSVDVYFHTWSKNWDGGVVEVYNPKDFIVENDGVFGEFYGYRIVSPRHPARNTIMMYRSIMYADMQLKVNIIESCDAMIHARSMGESFGLAICEFLYRNKPVLAWSGGNDQHHVDILNEKNLLYATKEDLISKMNYLMTSDHNVEYRTLVEKFSPKLVMNRFNKVFLQG